MEKEKKTTLSRKSTGEIKEKYKEGIGRRKTSTARVRIW